MESFEFHSVVQVVPFEDYTVDVYFADGKIVRYDASPLLGHGVFQPLRDKRLFLSACTVMNDTLAWDLLGNRDESECLDIDPETLHALPAVQERPLH